MLGTGGHSEAASWFTVSAQCEAAALGAGAHDRREEQSLTPLKVSRASPGPVPEGKVLFPTLLTELPAEVSIEETV